MNYDDRFPHTSDEAKELIGCLFWNRIEGGTFRVAAVGREFVTFQRVADDALQIWPGYKCSDVFEFRGRE